MSIHPIVAFLSSLSSIANRTTGVSKQQSSMDNEVKTKNQIITPRLDSDRFEKGNGLSVTPLHMPARSPVLNGVDLSSSASNSARNSSSVQAVQASGVNSETHNQGLAQNASLLPQNNLLNFTNAVRFMFLSLLGG